MNKVKKIRNIDRDVCCAEQKIAYNYAFSYYDIFLKKYQAAQDAAHKEEITQQAVDFVLKDITYTDKTVLKYNVDVIIIAFRNGFENYCNLKHHILNSYEEVGNLFKIPCEVQ